MADLPLRVAVVAPAQVDPTLAPALVSGSARTWLRARRGEPFAACLSTSGASGGPSTRLLAELETGFRSAARYSITTSLSRALQTAHASLREKNRAATHENQRIASGVVAAVRANGVYVARSGAGLVASVRAPGVWARSADPSGREMASAERALGYPAPPQVISEFLPFSEGDVVLLVPGLTVPQIPDHLLSAVLGRPLDSPLDALLALAPIDTAGLLIWWPPADAHFEGAHRWIGWTNAAASLRRVDRGPSAERPAPRQAPVPAEATRARRAAEDPAAALVAPELLVPELDETPPREAAPAGESIWSGWTRLAALLPLGVLLAIAFLLLRGVVPWPGGSDQSVAVAWHIIQGAESESDPDAKADLLAKAIDVLEPRAPRDEAARLLLHDAQKARDQVRNVVRVSRVHRFNLAVEEPFRPAGLWKGDDGLFVLDLGGQVLYRTDATGTQLTRVLKPGETYEEQPLGLLVTAAWSPPRAPNADGRLLVVDHLRSIVSLPMGGPGRRWWPPDGGLWQRIGPAAATYDDLFLLDRERGQIWRYPARLAGAAGSVAADTAREPQLGSALDIATDGNLYVLLPGGTISKLAPGGGKLPFEGTVPDRPMTAPTALFTQPDADRVWVLDPSASRVVEFTPQGSYVRQFAFPPEMVWNAIGLHVDIASRDLRVLTPQHVLLVQMD